jgi:NADH-quinone oxidoreductase subunit E
MNSPAGAATHEQPETFAFDAENLRLAKAHIAKYPPGRQASAVLPLLDMAPIRVYEVGSFYTMLHLRPVGRYLLQACTTTPCWLRGSDDVLGACKRKLGIGLGETTADGVFTLIEVECLGACVNAPILQVNDDFYEDLDGPATEALLEALLADHPPPAGSVIGRRGSEPVTGRTTLMGTSDDRAAAAGRK